MCKRDQEDNDSRVLVLNVNPNNQPIGITSESEQACNGEQAQSASRKGRRRGGEETEQTFERENREER